MRKVQLKNGQYLTIRPGVVADAEAYAAYVETVSGQTDFLTFGPGQRNSVEVERKTIAEFADSASGLFLVAEVKGRIIGGLTFRRGKRPRTAHAGEFGVTVDEGYWGLGIGRLLISELIAWAEATGEVRKINLTVREDNQRGIALYEKLGFCQEGRVSREFYSKGQFFDAYIMGLMVD